jgi:hypothetical protein
MLHEVKETEEQQTVGVAEFLTLEPFRLEWITSVGAAVHDKPWPCL